MTLNILSRVFKLSILFILTIQFSGCSLHEFVPKAFIDEGGKSTSEGLSDTVGVSFTQASMTVAEGQVATAILSLSDPAPKDIVIDVVLSGSATATTDYTTNLVSGRIEIDENDTSASVVFSTIDDTDIETQENVQIQVVNNSDIEILSGSFVLSINDNDIPAPVATIVAGTDIPETGIHLATVNLDIPAPSALVIPYSLSGTATEDTDYTALDNAFRFSAGDTSSTVRLDIDADAIEEPNETIIVDLQPSSTGTGNYTVGSPSTSTFTILDDDAPPPPDPVVSITAVSDSTPNEGIGSITVTVNIDTTPLNGNLRVDLVGNDGTAQGGGVDYSLPTTSLMFPVDQPPSPQTVQVSINNDLFVESDEIFTAMLSNVTGGSINPGAASRTITIEDNDTPPVVTIVPGTNIPESGVHEVRVNLDKPTPINISIPFNLGGSATQGTDYSVSSNSFNLTAGQTTKKIDLTIVDDSIDETPSENVRFILQSSGPTDYTLGSPSASTFTILDDDAPPPPDPVVSITAVSDLNPIESIGTVRVSVNIDTTPLNGDLTVSLSNADGTAQGGGIDYDLPATTFTFLKDVPPQAQFVDIDIVDDSLVEPTQDFSVFLTGVSGGAINPGADSAQINILDNDVPRVSFITNDLQHREPDMQPPGHINLGGNGVQVTLDQPHHTHPITVVFRVNGTALLAPPGTVESSDKEDNTEDYLIFDSPGVSHDGTFVTVVFNVGETSKSVTGKVMDDCFTEPDPDETMNFTVQSATIGGGGGSATIGQGTWNGFIRDNADDCSPPGGGPGFEVDPVEGEPMSPIGPGPFK